MPLPKSQSHNSDVSLAPRINPASHLQLIANANTGAQMSRLTISRIVARLRQGESEAWISRDEGITETQIRSIRSAEMRRIERALMGVKVCLNNTLELAKQDEADYWEEVAA